MEETKEIINKGESNTLGRKCEVDRRSGDDCGAGGNGCFEYAGMPAGDGWQMWGLNEDTTPWRKSRPRNRASKDGNMRRHEGRSSEGLVSVFGYREGRPTLPIAY